MFESISPFDDALAKPLLDEPVKKRWSLGTTVLSSKSSALSQSWGSSSSTKHAPAVPVYQASNHLDLEEIEFKSRDNAELGLLLAASPSSIGRTTRSREAYEDLDYAILQERHQDITDINQSLLQINEIGKGKYVKQQS
jgi:hypothetical protein